MSEKVPVLNSKRYKITGESYGSGCWGSVYPALDVHFNQRVAVKLSELSGVALEQMSQFGYGKNHAIERDVIPAGHYENLVWRYPDFDDDGNPIIIMAPCDGGNLAGKLREYGDRRFYLGNGLTRSQFVSYARDIIHAANEIHSDPIDRIYRDWKLENLVLDGNKVLLTDFGTSIAVERKAATKNRGHILTRAYEAFQEDGEVEKYSDVFGVGAIVYRLITGKYPLEELFKGKGIDEFEGCVKDADSNYLNTIKYHIRKNTPRAFWKFLDGCLEADPKKRIQDGRAAEKVFGKALRKYGKTTWNSRAKRWGAAAAAALVVTAGVAGYLVQEKQKGNLEGEILKASQNAGLEKKRRLIRLHFQGTGKTISGEKAVSDSAYSYDDYIDDGEFARWMFKFTDKRMAVASYLDANAVYGSIMDAGLDPNDGNISYDSIKPFLENRDMATFWEVWNLENTVRDVIQRDVRKKMADKVDIKWNAARKAYEKEKREKQIQEDKEIKELEKQKEIKELLPDFTEKGH